MNRRAFLALAMGLPVAAKTVPDALDGLDDWLMAPTPGVFMDWGPPAHVGFDPASGPDRTVAVEVDSRGKISEGKILFYALRPVERPLIVAMCNSCGR